MPPQLALLLWIVFLIGLIWFDPAKERGVSGAVWVPLLWMFILASRLPSQWLGGPLGQAAASLEDGNPLDRLVSSGLILASIIILTKRSFNWGVFFRNNAMLTALLAFALVSVVWSDFPLVALKRWVRDLGNYLVILVVMSDRNPVGAIRLLLRRLGFLLMPLSLVLVKYFPALSRQYDYWTGVATFVGATTSKNMLGLACLLSAIVYFWDILTRWSSRKESRTRRIILVDLVLIAMTLWLLKISNSATSRLCLALGCLVLAAAYSKTFRRYPLFLKISIPVAFVLYVVLAFGFNLNAQVAGAVGRDPTLTDRTKIWAFLLGMHTNPVIGTGYESFWLGPRLMWFWMMSGLGRLNEAHNGYLQVYLNLGLLGDLLLVMFLLASYGSIFRKFKSSPEIAALGLSGWTVLLFYNMSEAAFLGGLLWLTFLMGGLVVPGWTSARLGAKPKALKNSRSEDTAVATVGYWR